MSCIFIAFGFIFYKYLSEKMLRYANEILQPDGISYRSIQEESNEGQQYLEAIRDLALDKLGYFLKPSELSFKIQGYVARNKRNLLGHEDIKTTQIYLGGF